MQLGLQTRDKMDF